MTIRAYPLSIMIDHKPEPKSRRNHVKPKTIDKLRKIPCGKGHSRHDAYAYGPPHSNRTFLVCRTCQLLRYQEKKK